MFGCWGRVYKVSHSSLLSVSRRFEVFVKLLNDALKPSYFQGHSTTGLYICLPVAISPATDLAPRDPEAARTTMSLYPLQEHRVANSIFEGCAKEGRIGAFLEKRAARED